MFTAALLYLWSEARPLIEQTNIGDIPLDTYPKQKQTLCEYLPYRK